MPKLIEQWWWLGLPPVAGAAGVLFLRSRQSLTILVFTLLFSAVIFGREQVLQAQSSGVTLSPRAVRAASTVFLLLVSLLLFVQAWSLAGAN